MADTATRTDLAGLLTELARDAHDKARRKGLVMLYDYEGPLDAVDAPQAQLRELVAHGLEHILRRSRTGYVFFGIRVEEGAPDRCRLLCQLASNAATSGSPARPAEIALFPGITWEAFWQTPGESDIRGRSGRFDAHVSLHTIKNEGEVVQIDCVLQRCASGRRHDSADARGARAWLIASPPTAAAALTRRLQRLGWRTSVFASIAETRAALEHNIAQALPRLVIGMAADRVQAQDYAGLARGLPAGTLAVLAVPHDADVRVPAGEHGPLFRLVQPPIGPAQLLELTESLAPPQRSETSGLTVPAALDQRDRRRVLVVDDNAVNQVLAKEMLQLLGFDVAVADDGLLAVAECKRAAPQAVLMDVNMPRLNGLQATRELRVLQQRGALAKFVIIGTTADPHARDACLNAGMDEFITKPINLRELERLLQQVLV